MSILSEIQSHKKSRRFATIVTVVVLVFLAGMVYVGFLIFKETPETSIIPYIVHSGSITESISGDGKSLYRGYYNLAFPISGKVADVYKKEGEKVIKGEAIVALDDTYMQFDLEKAKIALETARANLIAKQATAPSIEDIRISEKQLEQAMLTLENTKRQVDSGILAAKQSLETTETTLKSAENDLKATKDNMEATLQSTINSITIAEKELQNARNDRNRIILDGSGSLRDLREKGFLAIDAMTSTLIKNLNDIDSLLGLTDVNKNKNDTFETYLGAKDISTKNRAESDFHTAKSALDLFLGDWNTVRAYPPYSETVSYMDTLYKVSVLVSDTLSDVLLVLQNSIASSNFPQSSIDNSITLFDSELSALKSQNSIFIAMKQTISTKEMSLVTDVKTRDDAINILISRLSLAKSTLQNTESNTILLLQASEARYNLAQKQVESSKLQYDTVVKQGKDTIASASKQVDIARASLDAKRKRVSPEELAPYEIAIRTAENSLKEAEQRLKDTILISPTDGVMTKVDVLVGEERLAGTPCISLVDTVHPYIKSSMEEIDIVKIHTGQIVHISFDALEGINFTGSVTFISPSSSIDMNGIVTYGVDIAFDPDITGVREGMSATIDYIIDEVDNVLVVPLGALMETGGKYSLFSLDRNAQIPVEIGISDGKMTEVRSGVKLGERIKSE
ncbi:MAG: efflux RND transporter periplasmic adaptor subunit [Candidatus Gracilibacteria bacterium]|nr:efflux RND transporter periplasmic adaptor subunit [Candidatus Gracilibacteria bacterium]